MQLIFVFEQVLNGLLVGAYYLLIALGLSLIFALGGIVNLAHGGFYAIGAYLAVVLAPKIGFVGAFIASPILVGGLGIVPGANLGESMAVFEAVHGSAPDIAGLGKANPTALMQSARLMLAHIGERDASRRLQAAIERVFADGTKLTGDLGGKASTEQFTDAVIAALAG